MTDDRKLAFSRLVWLGAFASLAVVVGGVFTRFFMIYGTDTLLVAPAAMGAIMLVTRLFDGVTDPLIAWLSDRKQQPRRRPLMLTGVPLFLVIIPLMLPPLGLTGWALVAYLLAFYLLYELGQTLRAVPNNALTFEVARTAKRRSFARMIAFAVSLAGGIVAAFLVQRLILADNPREFLAPFLLIGCPIATLVYAVGVWRLREVPNPHRTEERPPLAMFKEVLSNRHHQRYIFIQMAESVAYVGIFTSTFYVIRYVIERPEWTFLLLVTYTLCSIFSMVLWWKLVGIFGTKKTWLAGQYVWLVTLCLWPSVLIFGAPAYLVLVILAGIAVGCGRTVGFAMLGDIADYDARVSGRQRQGVYATIYSLIGKIIAALGGFLFGLVLQLADYTPNQPQGEAFTIAISVTTALVPALFIVLSIRLLKGFTLYEDEDISDGKEPRSVAPRLAAT